MAQPEVKQFRYFNSASEKNIPSIEENDKWKTNLLAGAYESVIKLGIQTLPGTKFYLNNNRTTEGIIIDHTGVYELDLRNIATVIHALAFDSASLAIIDAIDNANIIVDILYNNTEGTVTS